MKKFEFVLYINGHIICQRYFSVKYFGKEVLKSMDMKWLLDECVGIVQDDLKEKSVDYLYKQFMKLSIYIFSFLIQRSSYSLLFIMLGGRCSWWTILL